MHGWYVLLVARRDFIVPAKAQLQDCVIQDISAQLAQAFHRHALLDTNVH
jgi:hypothetical protein